MKDWSAQATTNLGNLRQHKMTKMLNKG